MAQQAQILGMKVQREYKGPAAKLVELSDEQERNYVGIAFYEQYRNHSALTNSLDGLMEFLQCPVARGITPLHSYGYSEGAFVYETGKCKSVAELIRQASDLGLSPGPRAGLELMTQALEILRGALRIAEEYAIMSHGGLTPWRLMIRPDGQLQIIGFAVPQVDVLDFKANPNLVPSEDSFRYAPPERMRMDEMEDFSSDIFSIALIGFELMTTRPMYDGSISAIQEAAQRADVSMRLNQAMTSGWLDQYTHDFLVQCLRMDHDDRFEEIDEALQIGKNLLRNQHLKGMPLFDLMSACSQQILRQSQDIEVLETATAMFDRNAITEEMKTLEAEQKRQKLREVTLGEPELEDVSTPAETSVKTGEMSKANLLDLLRQSSISAPEMPEIQTPPPKPKPQAGLQSDLLSALRSSKSLEPADAFGVEEIEDAEVSEVPSSNPLTNALMAEMQAAKPSIPSIGSPTVLDNGTPRDEPVDSKLAALFTAPARGRNTPEPAPESTPDVETSPSTNSALNALLSPVTRTSTPSVSSLEPVSEALQTEANQSSAASLLSALSAAKNGANAEKPEKETATSPVVQEPATMPAVTSTLAESTLNETTVKSAKPPRFPEEELPMLGEALDDDDGATAVMMRPAPKPVQPKSVQKVERSKEAVSSTSEEKPLNEMVKEVNKFTTPSATTIAEQMAEKGAPVLPIQQTAEATEVGNNSFDSVKNSLSSSATVMQINPYLNSLYESPIPVRSNFSTLNPQKYKISLGAGRGNIKQSCSPQSTAAQLISLMLLNRLLPMRMDLSGSLTSCYRVLEKGELTSGTRTLASYGTTTLMLGSVPSRTVLISIVVESTEGHMQFTAPVNWIVPVGSMIDYLVSWLRLPHRAWSVFVNDIELDAHAILFDQYIEDGPCQLILRPHGQG